MREYEVTIIIQPKLEDAKRTELIDKVTGWITDGDAAEENQPVINHWGMRKLAYPIKKNNEGYYVLYETMLDPTRIPDIERNFQFSEDMLRYLVVRKEDLTSDKDKKKAKENKEETSESED